jgi:Fic family protein
MPGYKWKEIADLPESFDALRDSELESLREVWRRERERLGQEATLDSNAQLAREWAIETGIIEGVYTLDRGITQTLIERGIDSAYISHDSTNRDPELVARIVQAHADVLEGLFAFVKGERAFSTGYIKELHAALLRHQEGVVVFDQSGRAFETTLEKGLYKRMPNNPSQQDGALHEYCPPEHVASEMDRLVDLYGHHEKREIMPHVEAAWVHHAFTQIHPFQDGNGRVARALATLVLIKREFFPLVVNRDDRERYIDALELADSGDLSDLVRLFAQIQKRTLTKAITKAVDVMPVKSVEEALAATRELLVDLGRIVPAEYLAAKEVATNLFNLTLGRFNAIVSKLAQDIARVNPGFEFKTNVLGPPPDELGAIAERLHYDPNTSDFHHSAAILFTSSGVQSRIVVSFQSVGSVFRGLTVAVAYFQVAGRPFVLLTDDLFRISYQEPRPEIERRYAAWLDECLIKGLAEWRRTLV